MSRSLVTKIATSVALASFLLTFDGALAQADEQNPLRNDGKWFVKRTPHKATMIRFNYHGGNPQVDRFTAELKCYDVVPIKEGEEGFVEGENRKCYRLTHKSNSFPVRAAACGGDEQKVPFAGREAKWFITGYYHAPQRGTPYLRLIVFEGEHQIPNQPGPPIKVLMQTTAAGCEEFPDDDALDESTTTDDPQYPFDYEG